MNDDEFPVDGASRQVEAVTMFLLGRLDGALRYCPQPVQRIFAGRMLRRAMIAALRQEGHAFTDARFQTWFAGLSTLSDPPARHARSPRAVCEAILAEMSHGTWPLLADIAARIRPALRAPLDLDADRARQDALDVTAQARSIIERCMNSGIASPLDALRTLHGEIASSPLFAPSAQAPALLKVGQRQVNLERPSACSPRWALEMLFGEWLRAQDVLPCALPLPDIVRLDTLGTNAPDAARALRAAALESALRDLLTCLGESARSESQCRSILEHRSTSRAPAAFELLAGFGAMRSSQIETMLGASRLGVRGMLASLQDSGLVVRLKISGAYMFDAPHISTEAGPVHRDEEQPAFSSAALDEYAASLSALDRLLGIEDSA
ncbi:hypothetical protein [Novosphingobium resinovorum]|uniref:hypothetical protein n=1 Tax=Novosphingobium resinovorum TaxID=158500 RepID=UPI002ED3E0C6|nr:hypothetical protein [Novosphingobium resinovorum]